MFFGHYNIDIDKLTFEDELQRTGFAPGTSAEFFSSNRIVSNNNYFDLNGKKGISDPEILKEYIINIYKTIMYRGIKGTFIYACNKELQDYFKSFIKIA